MIIFKDTTITNVSGHRVTGGMSQPLHPPVTPNRQKRCALKADAREHLHDLWTHCLLSFLRQEASQGCVHTMSSLERDFAAYVGEPKRFVEALIRALITRGILQFFQPAPKDNLPKSPSHYGCLRCEGMAWGEDAETITQTAASRNPSNENAVVLEALPLQGA